MLRDTSPVKPHSAASWLSRRITVRYSPDDADAGIASDGATYRRVKLHDISKGGLALLLRRPLTLGKELRIKIRNRGFRITLDLSAVVRHATPFTRGRWIVGLQFHQDLTDEQLANII